MGEVWNARSMRRRRARAAAVQRIRDWADSVDSSGECTKGTVIQRAFAFLLVIPSLWVSQPIMALWRGASFGGIYITTVDVNPIAVPIRASILSCGSVMLALLMVIFGIAWVRRSVPPPPE
jgi:hypothetical protein